MLSRGRLVGVAAAAAMVLGACGGSGGGGTAGDGADIGVRPQDGRDETRQGPATVEGARAGGTVTVLSNDGLNSMDPTEAYFTNTMSILQGLVTRSLTQFAYDADTGAIILVPDLATDLGTPNEDYTEWSFTLREGIRYENGQPVTVDDVAFGIRRSMDRSAFGDGAAYSNDYFLDGDTYKGPYTSPDAEYDGVTVDGDTITIRMRASFPDMGYWASFPAMGPIPEGEADPATYARRPWATGPYKFDEYVPEKSLTLVRNEEWDPATDPARTAYPDRYVFDFQTDNAKIDQILLNDSGVGQTTLTYDDVLNENFRVFRDEHPDRLVLGGQPCTLFWAPDYRTVTDKRVREAILWAYPYRDAVLAGGQIDGVTRITTATNLMPPVIPGREEYNPVPEHEPGTTDAAKARALLEEAGEVGYRLRFLYSSDDPQSVKAKGVIVAALTEAGFDPKPVATTVADFSTVRADPDAGINVRVAGWCSDWPSGSSWLPPLLETTDLDEEGLGANFAVFSEPEVDERIAAVFQLPLAEQPAAWNELDRHIAETYLPVIPVAYFGVAQAHGSRINGHHVDQSGMPTWTDIWVSP